MEQLSQNKQPTPLEALRELKYVHDTECGEDKSINERFAIIETELKDGEKYKTIYPLIKAKLDKVSDENLELKEVLEIIKELVGVAEEDFMYDTRTNKYYVWGFETTKDKFDFLKEMLL